MSYQSVSMEAIVSPTFSRCAKSATMKKGVKRLITDQKKSADSQRICQYDKCGARFNHNTHNQKYCNGECCRLATNQRIMDRYYEKKEIRSGVERTCHSCETKLSRYNFEDYCSIHERIAPLFDRSLIEEFV